MEELFQKRIINSKSFNKEEKEIILKNKKIMKKIYLIGLVDCKKSFEE